MWLRLREAFTYAVRIAQPGAGERAEGTTVEGSASGTGHITRALCGAGLLDHLRWRIFEFTEIVAWWTRRPGPPSTSRRAPCPPPRRRALPVSRFRLLAPSCAGPRSPASPARGPPWRGMPFVPLGPISRLKDARVAARFVHGARFPPAPPPRRLFPAVVGRPMTSGTGFRVEAGGPFAFRGPPPPPFCAFPTFPV